MARFRILTKMLQQVAVYWPPVGIGDNGEKIYGAPIEIPVRWEGPRMLRREPGVHSDTIKFEETKQVVYAQFPLVEGGVLWPGCLCECPTAKTTSPYDPFAGDELAKEITKYTVYPTIDAKQFLRVATL